MLSKYSDDVYEIVDITNNKLQVMDHDKKLLLVKKSDVIIISKTISY